MYHLVNAPALLDPFLRRLERLVQRLSRACEAQEAAAGKLLQVRGGWLAEQGQGLAQRPCGCLCLLLLLASGLRCETCLVLRPSRHKARQAVVQRLPLATPCCGMCTCSLCRSRAQAMQAVGKGRRVHIQRFVHSPPPLPPRQCRLLARYSSARVSQLSTNFAACKALLCYSPPICTSDAGFSGGAACYMLCCLRCLAVACAKPAPALPPFPLSPLAQAMQAVGEGRRPPEQGIGSVHAYGWLAGAAAVALAAFTLGARLASRS